MSLLQSILMGIIQGLTEFLPVSSSGHLALFKNIFNINTETGLLFDTMLHLGTLVAVCIVYWKDVKNLFTAAFQLLFDIVYNFRTWISSKQNGGSVKYRRLSFPDIACTWYFSCYHSNSASYFRYPSIRTQEGEEDNLWKRCSHRCRTGLCHIPGSFTFRYDNYCLSAAWF